MSVRTAGSFSLSEGDGRTDLGLLYGRRLRWGSVRLHGSAGAAYVLHEQEGEESFGGVVLRVELGWIR